MARRKCPHCGNTNKNLMQSNLEPERGVDSKHPDLTLLCIARVRPADWSFDHVKPTAEEIGADGLVPCSMQWDPNQ